MTPKKSDFRVLLKSVRKQLEMTQEVPVRELGMSFARINRWEYGKVKVSKLAKVQFDGNRALLTALGKLELTE